MHAAATLTDMRFRALADPVRREILLMVREAEHPAGQISERFDVTRPAVSRHLKVLRGAGLITMRTEGTTRYYRADQAAMADIGRWFEAFWAEGLPRLKALAEEEARRGNT